MPKSKPMGRAFAYGPAFPRPDEAYEDDHPEEPEERPTVAGVGHADPAFPFIARAFAMLAVHGFDTDDPDLATRAVAAGRKQHAAQLAAPKPPPPVLPAGYFPQPPPGFKRWTSGQKTRQEAPRVYYMRMGNRVKIGYSANLLERLKSINPEELMAVEPGHQDVERQRHEQFRNLRVHGEWFRLDEPLTSHIGRLAPGSRSQIEEIVRQRGRPGQPKQGRIA